MHGPALSSLNNAFDLTLPGFRVHQILGMDFPRTRGHDVPDVSIGGRRATIDHRPESVASRFYGIRRRNEIVLVHPDQGTQYGAMLPPDLQGQPAPSGMGRRATFGTTPLRWRQSGGIERFSR